MKNIDLTVSVMLRVMMYIGSNTCNDGSDTCNDDSDTCNNDNKDGTLLFYMYLPL